MIGPRVAPELKLEHIPNDAVRGKQELSELVQKSESAPRRKRGRALSGKGLC